MSEPIYDAEAANTLPTVTPDEIERISSAVAAAERARDACARAAGVDPQDKPRDWAVVVRCTRRDVQRLVGILNHAGFTGGRIEVHE